MISPAPQVSVIVPVAGGDYPRLPDQLTQLASQNPSCTFEVVVVDNDGRLELEPRDGVTVVTASRARGAAHARNYGALVARGEFLLFCDADDRVGPRWIDAHWAALQQDPWTVGATKVWPGPLGEDLPTDVWDQGWFSEAPIRHEGVLVADAANVGVRRDIYLDVGGMPEHLMRSEDVAFSLRLRRVGLRPRFVSDAQVLMAVGKRSRRAERLARYQRGRARIAISREYLLPPSPSSVAVRMAGRVILTARDALHGSQPWHVVGLAAGESAGAVRELLLPSRPRSRRALGSHGRDQFPPP